MNRNLWYDWSYHWSIGEIARTAPEFFAARAYVYISAIDSDRAPGSIPQIVDAFERNRRYFESLNPLVVTGHGFTELALDEGLFCGFDEIWVPSTLPIASPPPSSLMAPVELPDDLRPELVRWIFSAKLQLGLGDGYGVNGLATVPELLGTLGFDSVRSMTVDLST